MDYKEKYEQALERARQFSEKPYLEDSAGIVEYIFPELKEPEDERIRKFFVNYAEHYVFYNQEGFTKEEALAWLEKQCEQNPADVSKQEPIDTTDLTDFEKCFQGMCCDKNQKFVKECCVSLLELARKQIQEEQKPWSEEDESHIRYLIECLEHCKRGVALTMTTSTAQEYINWLKSLRPQPHWEPSDEQMELLREVQQALLGKDCHNRFVNFMYELKRLREEQL